MSDPARRLRIAVYHNLPSGGGKRALTEMVRGLAPRHEIDVYTLSCADHDFADLRPLVNRHTVYPFEPSRLFRSPLGRLNQIQRARTLRRLRELNRAIARDIDDANYDMAFVHHCRFSQSPTILTFLQTRTVYYCQEPLREFYEPNPRNVAKGRGRQALDRIDPLPRLFRRMQAGMDRESALAAGTVLVNSHYSRENFYRAYGRFSDVCYLGVDTCLFRPSGREREAIVLSVGYLGPRKGFDFLIRSLGTIDESIRPRLVIAANAAEPAEGDYLSALAARSGVALDIRTRVSDAELVDLYNSAIATLYAPIMEPFGFVPIESMACGTPVVGVNEAGVRETVVDGQSGFLCPRDEQDFAAAVVELVTDRACQESLGRQARLIAEQQWQWAATAERLEKVFRSVVESRPERGPNDTAR